MDRVLIEAKDELLLKNIHVGIVGSKLNFSISFDYIPSLNKISKESLLVNHKKY